MTELVVTQPANPAPLNERSFRLFSYLRELTALNLTRVTDLSAYDRVVWFGDVPENSACFSILRGAAQEGDENTWIEIRKRNEPRLPQPPAVCDGWYANAQLKNDTALPTLYDQIRVTDPKAAPTDLAAPVALADRPSVAHAWHSYLEAQWKPWSHEHRTWRLHHEFYSSLFTIEQQVKRLGEAYELLVGIGLLTWVTPTGERVRRHLVAARALLSFDTLTGTISLRPAAEGAKPALEYDMLEPDLRPEPNVIKAADAMVNACGENLWSEKLKAPLRAWINAMSDRGMFLDSARPPDTISSHPVVSFAPALILRRRTRRSLVTFLQNIAERLKTMSPLEIPFGVRRLVEITGEAPDSEEAAGSEGAPAKSPSGETFFPLPSNDEQRLIVARLRRNRGVLVQGPPGTGKSQTIANLICHLLAEGKRILVTSQTERALKVLQSKLPEELQALCVTVLGADETALKNMERSVLGINERQTDWDASRNASDIRRLESELQSARDTKHKAEMRLRQLRESGFQQFAIAGNSYRGTAGAIAKQLEAQQAERGWIEDAIAEPTEAPISDAEFQALHATLVALSPARRRECAQHVAIPSSIRSPQEFVELVRAEREAKARLDEFSSVEARPNTKHLATWTTAERQKLRAKVEAVQFELAALRSNSPNWMREAICDSLSGRAKPWSDLLAAMEIELRKLEGKKERAYNRELTLPARDKTIIRGDAEALLDHLHEGGGLGWGPFRAKCVRQALYIVREVRVNGRPCDDKLIIEELVEHLHLERSVEVLWGHCAAHTPKISGTLSAQISELEQFVLSLRRIVALVYQVEEIRSDLRLMKGAVEPVWSEESGLAVFLTEIDSAEAKHLLTESQASFRRTLAELESIAATPNAHASVAGMIDAVARRLAEDFAREHERMVLLLRDRERLVSASSIAAKLRRLAPMLTGALEADPGAAEWALRSRAFTEAWTFARARSWMVAYLGGMDAATAEAEVKRGEIKIAQTLERLASAHAWRHCLTRLTEAQRQHMIAWKNAIKRIGKGTGVRAHLHRQHAREHMEECRSAIPAWIMPYYRVAETTSDTPEPYDVVIVDEASQSGPEACALMYLAKRCIIVGDDKQISPEAVGIERAQVDQLSEQYLFDIPHNDSFGAESSLFSQAQIRFGGRIRLREHFRCMPEIIRFSNDLCYQDEPLLPLRQYTANRLSPIEVRHVPNGMREGDSTRARNRAEATAVVEQILSCLRNPQYAGKTMGVISLLGESQAELIREMVVSQVEPREIEERELSFGDAYAFQGDERDIIFLSMVAAPNVRNATLANSKAEQRFNVATSRARDQIWLFHTIALEDLNTGDVRYRLLSYYLNPAAPPPLEPDWSKCDSKFEETIGRIIYDRGFRVIPQFEPFGRGGKRLDFVVEGTKARLAVECDGDAFHTAPDDVHNDLVRQRQLERCGWTFWRISDSEFYWDRLKSMESLWQLLARLGIEGRKEPAVANSSEPRPELERNGKSNLLTVPQEPRTDTAVKCDSPISVPRDTVNVDGDDSKLVQRKSQIPWRMRPNLEPLEKFVLDILDGNRKMEIQSLILDTLRRLNLGIHERRRVEMALRGLEEKALIRCGVNYVERQFKP